MLKLKPFESSARFEFRDPDTGIVHRERNITDLYKRIILYRTQNGLSPIEELDKVVEHYLCSLPENVGKCQENELQRSLSQYVKGGIVLLKNMAFGKYVSLEEAEKREEQCIKCVNNVFPDKGPFLQWADDIAISQVGERRTRRADELGSCKVCSCPLKSKVFFGGKLPLFEGKELEEFRKVSCWQLKITNQE